jgi:hypothetical protein
MPITKHGDGSFTAEKEFNSIEEAREYLSSVAFEYYSDKSEEENEADINYHLSDWGLTIDAASAGIEEIEENNG